MPGRPSLFVRCRSSGGSVERAVPFEPGQTLAQAVYLAGFFVPPALCSGLGRCGRCRVRILPLEGGNSSGFSPPLPEEERFFPAEDLARGWRLGCKHPALPNMLVELPEDTALTAEVLEPGMEEGEHPPRDAGGLLLAVDLGTTTLEWAVFRREPQERAETGARFMPEVLLSDREINPQMGAGSDVISRLALAATPGGGALLAKLTRAALQKAAHRGRGAIEALCLAANPAMTCITLGKDTRALSVAPYGLPYAGGAWEELPGLPPMWIPPQISPFVGGDLSAGYAAIAMAGAGGMGKVSDSHPVAYPFLLADLGTNGEFLLAMAPDTALAASVALGPALEGIGLSCGTEARPLAVTGFTLSPGGLVPLLFSEHGPPLPAPAVLPELSGITGTGYLSLLHTLRKAGAMDVSGSFTLEKSPLLRRRLRLQPGQGSGGEPCLELPGGLYLTATDVEEILKVKAAFSLGLRLLLEEAGTASHRVARVFLAGAFGGYVEPRALEELGFFPPGMGERMTAVGNAALGGAALLLCRETARNDLTAWAARVRSLDLASHPVFMREYARHMRFGW